MEAKLQRDLKVLADFIDCYCEHRHAERPKVLATLKTHDITAIAGRPIALCGDCGKLLAHAFVKRTHCPMDPKPQCKHCPNHCYHPKYRAEIQQVMRFSGPRLLLSGKVGYLLH